jgi:ABC-type lipoprotein export system ATPase subunit
MSSDDEYVLKAHNICKSYPDPMGKGEVKHVIKSLDLVVRAGERISILGGSGSGKSTLLNILALLDIAEEGLLQFQTDKGNASVINGKIQSGYDGNKDLLRASFGFVFQTPFMLSNFDAQYNISLPLHLSHQKLKKSDIAQKAKKMLEDLGIRDESGNLLSHNLPDALSGGQRQRVAMGRALIHSPKIVFADEPTGNLDPITARIVMETLKNFCEHKNAALILVTHDPCMAIQYTENIYLLVQGKLIKKVLSKNELDDMKRCCNRLPEFASDAAMKLGEHL